MLLATRKTKNNLVRTVLASGVLISSMAYMNTAYAGPTAIAASTNSGTIGNPVGDYYNITADNVTLTINDGYKVENDTTKSIENNATGAGKANAAIIFAGSSEVTGSIGATNPVTTISFNNTVAGSTNTVTIAGSTNTTGAVIVQNKGSVTLAPAANLDVGGNLTVQSTNTRLVVGGTTDVGGTLALKDSSSSTFTGDAAVVGNVNLTENANAAFGKLNAVDLDIQGVDHTVTVGGILTLTRSLIGAGTGTSTLAVTGASAIIGDIDASENFRGTFKGNVALANIFTDNTSTLTFNGQANPTTNIATSATSTINLNGGGQTNGTVAVNDSSTININANYIMDQTLKLSNGAAAGARATVNVAVTKTLQVDGAITLNKNAVLNVLGTLDNDAVNTVDLTLLDTATANLNIAQIGRNIIQAAGTTLNFTGGLVDAADLQITGAGNVGVSSGADVQLTGALTNGGTANARFTFDLGDTDTPGTITAAGNADIVATQTVTLLNYDLSKLSVGAAETKDLIVSGGGMTVGVTPNLVENLSNVFIKFTLSTPDTQHLQLVATRQVPTGLEGNANSLGGVFAQIDDTNASGALLQLVNGLGDIASSPEALNEELAEIAPQGINGSLVDSSFGVTNETFDLFSQRINELRAGVDSYNTGYAAGHMTEKGHGTWVKVFGSHADQNRRGNIAGYTGETWGLAGGADIMITDRHLVGVSLAWASTDVNFDSQRGGSDINSYQGAFYGSWNVTTPLYVNWMASAAFNKYKETQIISTGGFNQTSLGEFDGWQYGARAEVGYIFGEECFHIIPTADLTYTHASFDSFQQKGNSTANQIIDYGSVSALLAGVGVKFSYDYEMEKALLQPEAHVNVSYDIIGDEMDANSRFVGFGTSYNVQGASVKRTDYNVGLSLTTYGDSGLGFSISYDYDWKSGFHAHSGFARIRYEW